MLKHIPKNIMNDKEIPFDKNSTFQVFGLKNQVEKDLHYKSAYSQIQEYIFEGRIEQIIDGDSY